MTTTGSGVGGSVGGPVNPMPNETQATAWVEVNKAALGIVHDSIERTFIELNPRYTTGYIGGFGYRSTASRPLLDHPLESTRMKQAFDQPLDEGWQGTYGELVGRLPPELQKRFLAEGRKPFEQRNTNFVALDNLLTATAKTLTQLHIVSQPAGEESLEAARTLLNQLLPIAALKGSIENGSEIGQSLQDFLASEGANYRYFDGFNNALGQTQEVLRMMERVNAGLNTTPNGELSPQTKAIAGKAADLLASISSQLARIGTDTDLQILQPTLKALEIVATSLALPHTHSASLFIALSIAAIGLKAQDSETGVIGPSLAILLDSLSQGVSTGTMPDQTPAGHAFFGLLNAFSVAAFISLASQTVETGLGIFPMRDPQDGANARFFTFEAALELAINSGFVPELYRTFIEASGGGEKAQMTGSSIAAPLIYLFAILSGAQAVKHAPTDLISSQASHLDRGLIAGEEVSEQVDNEQAIATTIAIKQAIIALSNHDYEEFLGIFNGLLESIGTSLEALQTDIETIRQFAATVVRVTRERDEENPTGIVHVI